MNNNILNITFKDGKGHCNIDLNTFFTECNNSQLKTMFSMVKEDYTNIDKHIADIRNYINAAMDYYSESEDTKRYFQKDIKKLISKANVFCKYFNLPEMEFDNIDKPVKVKFEKIFVYTMLSDSSKPNNRNIFCFPGYRFEKYGMTFHVYGKKSGRKTYYNVIVPSIGLAIGNDNCTNKQAAADQITDRMMEVIRKQCKEHYTDWYNTFIETAKNSEYPQVLTMDDYKPIAEYYNKPETAISTDITVNNTDNNTVTENKPETAIESAYNNIDIDLLHNKFREIYSYLYDNNNCYPGYNYRDCMNEFDNNFSKYKTIATMLSEKRHDYISSDRECAAFIIALDIISKKPEATKNDPEVKTIAFIPSKWNLSKRHNTISSMIGYAALKAIYSTIAGNMVNNTSINGNGYRIAYKGLYKPPILTSANIPCYTNSRHIKTSAIEYIARWNNSIPYYDSS